MNFKPILFSTEMVRAIQKKTKTQTRRVIKMRDGSLAEASDISLFENGELDAVMDFTKDYPHWRELKPRALPGDCFWVRETFSPDSENIIYRADVCSKYDLPDNRKWKPSIFMPKKYCRIFLEVEKVRVERLNDISENDSINEGIANGPYAVFPKDSFKKLWESINGDGSWNVNPYVWVYHFKMIDKPISFIGS